ncbi:MAG: prepilin-type N-terminal cleavage/methylation domain-containing protein [Actinobacteria bacterium]|nr:prepilin-type N-terminal cleavage/methylation domain-containing protein [Actinomycetota bacterium]MBV8561695.1 prepilin-type N-terminal cleavage/methylation domain-containing protein [Actinomycetota bacterium]
MRLRDEHGFTITELIVAMVVGLIVMTGVVQIMVSGMRTSADATARIAAQQNARLALDRLEYEARCATSATVVGGGAGISLVLPAQCSHGTGNVCWGVASGVLTRYPSSSCSGANRVFVRNVTSAAPFSLQLVTGDVPRLQIQLSVDTTNRASDALTVNDTITLRNAPRS